MILKQLPVLGKQTDVLRTISVVGLHNAHQDTLHHPEHSSVI